MKRISVGLDQDQIDVLESGAAAAGVSRAEFFRALVLSGLAAVEGQPGTARLVAARREYQEAKAAGTAASPTPSGRRHGLTVIQGGASG